MADTRGIDQDALHKKSIAAEIENHLGYVHAVLILANGSDARNSASLDYALSVLPALFPKSLANNIAFLFSNVPTLAALNFPHDAIPEALKGAHKFLIDNPVALQKNYLKQKGHVDWRTENKIKKAVECAEENALEMLVELFAWLDGLEPQPTTEIIAISKKYEDIESKITSILNYTKDVGLDDLAWLAKEYAGLSLAGCFSGPLEKTIRLLEDHCEKKEEQGGSRDQLEKMRASLKDMKRRLDVLRKAREKVVVNPES